MSFSYVVIGEMFTQDDLISSYSRSQGLADGVLVDVTKMAKEAGFVYPVAMTRTLYSKYLEKKPDYQHDGRLWDILYMAKLAAKRGGSQILFKVKLGRKLEVLKMICGPGDTREPVITIMFPDED